MPQPIKDAKTDEETIYLYDTIGMWGVDAEKFVRDITGSKAKTIHLRINSPGGSVFDARAMETAIAQSKANTIAHIDGMAASAATYIAMAADEVEISEGGFFMIHNAMSMVMGNKDDMLQEAALLEKIDDSISKTYQRRTGKDEAEVKAWMNSETWFTADEALESGFVDRVFKGDKPENKFDLSKFNYRNIPDGLLNGGEAEPEEVRADEEELTPTEDEIDEIFDRSADDALLQLLALG